MCGIATFVLPRFLEKHAEREQHARILAKVAAETGRNVEEERRRHAHTAVDGIALRGIPAVGPGWAGGAIAGSRPEPALIAKQPRE